MRQETRSRSASILLNILPMTEKTMPSDKGFIKLCLQFPIIIIRPLEVLMCNFFSFCMLKVGMVLMLLTFRQLEHLHPTPANTPFH